eukprot:TRINITY_DN1146_c0_g1_i3.p1 TRINITY_DN1146_c0_g1~~TRINITY_DN1146_c0_g1_i3.p1  ORF type:complete len:213 (+),score=45.18 TRINITY_DN1146_c0_g1_i3:64-702(+)
MCIRDRDDPAKKVKEVLTSHCDVKTKRSFFKAGGTDVEVVIGDLTEENVDAIVNAANSALIHGGGVAGAIARKAGPVISEESRRLVKEKGPIPTGKADYTGAGNLKCKYVIHAVGPIWRGGHKNEEALLESCILEVLKLADSLKLETISLPAISAGIFGYPRVPCANVLLGKTVEYLKKNLETTTLKRVRFVMFEEELYGIFKNELERIFLC